MKEFQDGQSIPHTMFACHQYKASLLPASFMFCSHAPSVASLSHYLPCGSTPESICKRAPLCSHHLCNQLPPHPPPLGHGRCFPWTHTSLCKTHTLPRKGASHLHTYISSHHQQRHRLIASHPTFFIDTCMYRHTGDTHRRAHHLHSTNLTFPRSPCR